jgi:hypothetical protein
MNKSDIVKVMQMRKSAQGELKVALEAQAKWSAEHREALRALRAATKRVNDVRARLIQLMEQNGGL